MTGNILTAFVTIRGVRPLLWHHFGEDAIPLERQERTGVAGNDPEEWKKTYLALPSGALYIQGTQVFSSIRDGAKHVKKGARGSIQADLSSTLQVEEDVVEVGRRMPQGELPRDPTAEVYLDVRSVRNPNTRSRNVRYRVATRTGWVGGFHITWDRIIIPRDQMREALRFAGQLAGIGDGRAVGFGRYEVVSFEVADD